MANAHTFAKGGTERTIVMHTKRHFIQPFRADAWLDLRVGFFVSLTNAAADDTITGLAETIPSIGNFNPRDSRYWIGLKTEGDAMPGNNGVVFIGFSNSAPSDVGYPPDAGASQLVSSDIGDGTTNTNFWRPANDFENRTGFIIDGTSLRRDMFNNWPHFVQNVGGAGGYATLLGFRLQRDNPTSRTVRVSFPKNLKSADILFSSTPTLDLLRSELADFPVSVFQMAAVELSALPTALFFYHPFLLSRLRFHAIDALKVN